MSENGRPDGALRTPWQIRTADLDRLREDERLWTAYERGWCDFLQMYLDSKLMQGETDYITLRPTDRENANATAAAAVARDSRPSSSDSPPRSTDADDSAPSGSDVAAWLTTPPAVEDEDALQPQSPVDADGDEELNPTTERRRRRLAETASPSGSDGGGSTDAIAEGYASDDSSRDADSEVRRVMFGDMSPDSSEAEAMRSFSVVHGSSADDSAGSSE